MILIWNVSIHNVLGKLKNKSLAAHNRTQPKRKTPSQGFFLKIWPTLQTKELFIFEEGKQNHLCLLKLSLIGARFTKLDA